MTNRIDQIKHQKYTKLNYQERRALRERYIVAQDGKCFYCKKELTQKPEMNKAINWSLFPPNFLKYLVHLQHNHETDMTEGAVHAYCNAVMWEYEGI